MKKALKVTFGTMLAASMVSTAFAHEQAFNHFAVWGAATYTKPTNNSVSVGDLLVASGGALDGARRHAFIEPENQFDYAFGITYRFPHHHTRLFFSYDHYDNREESGDINIRNLGFEPAQGGVVSTAGLANVDMNNHELRGGAIHDLHFGDHFCLDLLAFLEYDKLRHTVNEFVQANPNFFVHTRETEQKFRGFGPGIGAVTRWYVVSPQYHVFAGINTSLLYGINNYNQTFNTENVANFYIYQPDDSKSLVQKLDINFGLNYHCAFKHEMHGAAFDIALGMRYMNMINVLKHGNVAYNNLHATDNAGWPANIGMRDDWGRWGPFLKFKIGGAHS